MKKVLLIILCLLLIGCGNDEVSNDELEVINNDIINYLANNQYDNLIFNYVDYDNKNVVVGLSDNSVEKQIDFKEKIVDSEYVKFVEGKILNDEKKEYTINIPKLDDVNKVMINTMSQYDNMIEIINKEDIERIYNIFYNRTTYNESISKNPENVDELFNIIFIDKRNNNISIYIYKKDNKYYLEQTNNGVYETSLNDFSTIKEYIKD